MQKALNEILVMTDIQDDHLHNMKFDTSSLGKLLIIEKSLLNGLARVAICVISST